MSLAGASCISWTWTVLLRRSAREIQWYDDNGPAAPPCAARFSSHDEAARRDL
jgi:hypothetical protein